MAETAAELLPAAPGDAPQAALAAATVRGRFVVLLDPACPPSAAALLALARAIAAAPDDVLLSAAVARAAGALIRPPASDALRLPAPLGVLIGGPSELWRQIGGAAEAAGEPTLACADLALRARLLGRRWRVVEEARAETATPVGRPLATPNGAAILHARWGFGA